MRVVNVVVKFLVHPQTGSFVIANGEVKIFGLDDATSALLQTEFQELQPSTPVASTSSSVNSSSVLSTAYGDASIELDEALAKITCYLNALDQQDFTIVSAFKDEFPVASSDMEDRKCQQKMYVWTMQK